MSVTSFGDNPSTDLNVFCKCPGLTASRSASSSIVGISSASFRRIANALVSGVAAGPGKYLRVGLHRRHARNPACSASAGVVKNATFSRFGLRDEHDGRQHTPVVCTPKEHTPSNYGFLARPAIHRQSSRSFIM